MGGKTINAHCFFIYLQSVKVLHNLSQVIQQKVHSKMISSKVLSNQKNRCLLGHNCWVNLDESLD